MAEELNIGCIFKRSGERHANAKRYVVLRIYSDDYGGWVEGTPFSKDPYAKGENGDIIITCRIVNHMIPDGKATIEELLTSPNKHCRELGVKLSQGV